MRSVRQRDIISYTLSILFQRLANVMKAIWGSSVIQHIVDVFIPIRYMYLVTHISYLIESEIIMDLFSQTWRIIPQSKSCDVGSHLPVLSVWQQLLWNVNPTAFYCWKCQLKSGTWRRHRHWGNCVIYHAPAFYRARRWLKLHDMLKARNAKSWQR